MAGKKTAAKIQKPATIIGIVALVSAIVYWWRKKAFSITDVSGSLKRLGSWTERPLHLITDITIHHSASQPDATYMDFHRWHTQEKGWNSIGYHFVIYQDGRIFQTNALDSISYHNGYNNSAAIGVCLVGNFEVERVPSVQMRACEWLCNKLRKEKDLVKLKRLVGHREYISGRTACPGRNLDLDKLRKATSLKGVNSVYAMGIASNAKQYWPSEADN